jgi:AcrR family transcriptional regulator
MARPRQVSNEQILLATRACVLESGPQVPLDEVAERLGVTSPALLKRFGNRQNLLLQALRPPVVVPFRAELHQGPDASLPLEGQLEALFTKCHDFMEQVVPGVAVLRESGIPHHEVFENDEGPINFIRDIARWVQVAVQVGLAEAQAPESVATAMLGAIQTRVFTAHVTKHAYSSRSSREYLKDLAQLFTRALSVSRAPARRSVRRHRRPTSPTPVKALP